MITVCIPALNEEKKLADTVKNILTAAKRAGDVFVEVIIVNDGSTDNTKGVIEELEAKFSNVKSIHFLKNKGIGEGFLACVKQSTCPKIMFVAGDNDLHQDLLTKIFENHNNTDMVFAYYLNKELRGRGRNILSTLFATIYMLSFDVFVQYISGPCLYPVKKLREMKIYSRRFSIVPEMSIKLLRSGCSFCEVGGFMQTGKDGSSSVSLINLIEVMYSYLRLFFEIKILKPKSFMNKPKRLPVKITKNKYSSSKLSLEKSPQI